jgi:hypothetical protein
MTDCAIVRLLLKENFKDIFKKLENSGGILYLNNSINKWFLSIFIQGISEIFSNFIWDMFILEGNIIIFKAIYAIIIILQKQLKIYKSLGDLNKILNDIPLGFNDRAKLAFYLIGKKFNFNMDIIKKYRKTLSLQIIKEIVSLGTFKDDEDDDDEDDDKNKNKKKEIICDLDWPLCIKDKKNLEKEYDYVVLKELDEPNVIEDFIDYYNEYKDGSKKMEYKNKSMNFLNDDDIESQKIKYFKEERFKDILIERKKHYCGSNIMSIRSFFYKSKINKNNKEKDKENVKIKKTRSFFNEKEKEENINERDRRIDRIVTQVFKGNQNKISFIKENVEKNILIDDEKDEK